MSQINHLNPEKSSAAPCSSLEEAPPVTGEPGAAPCVGYYDAREALLQRVSERLEEMYTGLNYVWASVIEANRTLENAAEHDAGLLLSAQDTLRLGTRLGTASLRISLLREYLSALLEECRG